MKNKIFKPLFLALLLPVLAGCSILDNTIATIALNMVFESKLVINHAALENGDLTIKEYDTLPTTTASRADLTYGFEALAIPEYVAVSQMNIDIEIEFTITFSEGAQDLFYIEEMSTEDAAEETPAEARLKILYPVGTLDKPASLETIGDWVNIERLVDLKKETSKDISITVTGKAKNKTKSATYYFNLNSDGITLPGGGDIDIDDIDPELALYVTEANKEGTLDLTVTPAELVAGKTFSLQVMWADITFGDSQSGVGTVGIKNLNTLEDTYDFTLPPSNTLPLTSNGPIGSYIFTIKLKEGATAPTAPLVLTVSLIVAPN